MDQIKIMIKFQYIVFIYIYYIYPRGYMIYIFILKVIYNSFFYLFCIYTSLSLIFILNRTTNVLSMCTTKTFNISCDFFFQICYKFYKKSIFFFLL